MTTRGIWRFAAIFLALMCVACSRQASPVVESRALSSEDAVWWAPSMSVETGSVNGPEPIKDSGATLWWLTSARAQALVKGTTSVIVNPPPCRDTAEFVVTQNGSSKRHRVGSSGVKLTLGDPSSADKSPAEKGLVRVTFDVVSESCNLSGSSDTRTFFLGIVEPDAG